MFAALVKRLGKDKPVVQWQWAYSLRVMMSHLGIKYLSYLKLVATVQDKAI